MNVAHQAGAIPAPPWWRLALAFLIAPILPALLFAEWEWRGSQSTATLFDRFMLVSILGAYPAAILCGIPALVILRKRVKPTLLAIALAGGLVASLPWWIFAILSGSDMIDAILETALPAFVLGLLGGVIFFIVGVAGFRNH